MRTRFARRFNSPKEEILNLRRDHSHRMQQAVQTARYDPEIDFALFCTRSWITEHEVWNNIMDLGVPALAKEVSVVRPDLNSWLVAHIMYNQAFNQP